ncbi:MAG: hypothetical protein ACFCU5_09390 [Pleurocapsa sp.]
MLRDASHQQVIEKFSFIYTLTLSDTVDSSDSEITEELIVDHYQFLERSPSKQQNKINSQSSSLVTTASVINHQEDRTNAKSDLAEIVKFFPADGQSDRPNPQAKANYLGKILFIFACGYLIFVFWWLLDSQSGRLLAFLTGKKQVFISQSDAEFIDYAERSLAAIDRKIQANQKEDTSSESQVVYVPVYSPATPTPTAPQLPDISPTPPPPPLPDLAKIPTPPPLPEPTPLPQAAPPPEEKSVVATSVNKPATKHTLIGILELGDKSAALFNIEGMTKRIWLGEEIDNSGWILESVNNQQAKINYQGKIRSLSVGETF